MYGKNCKVLRSRSLLNRIYFGSFACIFLFFLAGCADILPPTSPLSEVEEQQASLLLQRLQAKDSPALLDTDITISWQGYGQTHILTGSLQATQSGCLRFASLDPLGRPVFILVVDSRRFTLVNSREGRAYIGAADATFLRQYLPLPLSISTIFSLLVAQPPEKKGQKFYLLQKGKTPTYWVDFASENNHINRQVGIDPLVGMPTRQLVVEGGNQILLDVRYDRYRNACDGWFLPSILTVKGKDLPGSFRLELHTVYCPSSFAESWFQLQIPRHFSITAVE